MLINIHAAKTNLSQLVDRAAEGEEIVIARAGKPVAKLVGLMNQPPKAKRVLGRLAGQIRLAPYFDAPLPDAVLDPFTGR